MAIRNIRTIGDDVLRKKCTKSQGKRDYRDDTKN